MLGYIRGERYSLAVDAGNSRRHVEKFYAALDAAELRRPDFTVLTHWHWDHTFGLHAVDGAAIACEATNEMLCRASRWRWSEEAMRERLRTGEEIEFCDKHIRAEYPDRKEISVVPAGLVFHGRLSIDLGGVHCVLLQTEAPHERDCVLVHVPEQGILFAGDADCGGFYSLDGGYDKAKIKTTLVVGDAGADILAAQAMGADFCAVLTGIQGERARGYFEKLGANYILKSVEDFLVEGE